MRVLALASQKGGSGKTMLASHLAIQAAIAGAGPVVLIDIDPRGALADWWNVREDDSPAFAQTTAERLAADIQMLRVKGFRLAIIDTPSLTSAPVADVVGLAELVMVPTRPHGDELRAAGGTVDLCARAGKPLLFVVNGTTPGEAPSNASIMQLARHGPVAPHPIDQAPDIAAAMLAGRTLIEDRPDHAVAGQIAGLWGYIAGRIEKNFRRTVFAVPRAATSSGFGRRGL